MGLIKAIAGAAGGALADSWREYFYCEALGADILVQKGAKRTSSRSSNTRGNDNIISNGSIIAVNNGQCMIIVEQGKVVEVSAEPGEFVYDTSTEPSCFYGGFGEGLKKTFQTIGKRFTFGGDTAKDQRVYFFNTKEIIGNKYGTASPIPFRVIDKNFGLDMVVNIKCFGEYSYKFSDPIIFYTNVCGNVEDSYNRSEIDSQLKTELMTALQPAMAKIAAEGIAYYELPGYTEKIADALNEELSQKWGEARGIKIASFGVSSVKASDEDEAALKQMQRNAVLRDPTMAAATIAGAQAQAMQDAAKNTSSGGAFMAFAGMNMAGNAGGMNAGNLFNIGQQQQQAAQQGQQGQAPAPAAGGWTCSCGHAGNQGRFCAECGKPKPEESGFWTCSCGAKNQGKFCAECGKPKPAGEPLYKCDKCGWTPPDPHHPPKFCPNCGDPFDDSDAQK